VKMRSLVELVLTVAVAIGAALLIQAFIVKPYRIPSGSMEPTLSIGQRILANRMINHPSLGDVVVFHPPSGADSQTIATCGVANEGESPAAHLFPRPCGVPTPAASSATFIKRVVGVPGDRIAIVGGHVYRNGVREQDPYITPCGGGPECTFPQAIVVPPGDYFMMGDNRGASDDSRYWGPVPDKWVIGVAFFTYWPPGRIGFL
jgi:signal peptidase I